MNSSSELVEKEAEHHLAPVPALGSPSGSPAGRLSNIGDIDLHRENIALAKLIERSLEVGHADVARKDHTSEVFHFHQAAMLNVDELRLSQVIVNLLNNAIRYTPNVGRLTFDARIVDNKVSLLKVEDKGQGVTAEYLERIFESFVQVPEAGQGIGLRLCKHIVTMHGGSVTAKS